MRAAGSCAPWISGAFRGAQRAGSRSRAALALICAAAGSAHADTTTTSQVSELVPAGLDAFDHFGASIVATSNWVLVDAPDDDADWGVVWVCARYGGTST